MYVTGCGARAARSAYTRASTWTAKSGGGWISSTASKARARSADCWRVSSLNDMALTPFIGVEKLGQGSRQAPFDGFPTYLQNTCDLVIQEILEVAQNDEFAFVHPQPP